MLDKQYKFIQLDLNTIKQNTLDMEFSISDNQTSDFYIIIKKNDNKIDLSEYKTTLYIKNPNDIVLHKELTDYNKTDNVFYCNLESIYKNIEGKYSCQIIIENPGTTEKVVPLGEFYYTVKNDIISEESDIPSGEVNMEYIPESEKIVITGNMNYDATTESIIEVI